MVGSGSITYMTSVPLCLVNELGWHFRIFFRWWNLVLLTWEGQRAFSSRCLHVTLLVTEYRPPHCTASALSVKLVKLQLFSHMQLLGWFRCLSSSVSVTADTKTAVGEESQQGFGGSIPRRPRKKSYIQLGTCKMKIFYLENSFHLPTVLSCSFQFVT